MKKRIVEIRPSQKEAEDSNYPKDDNIEHHEMQSSQKTDVHKSPIRDEELSEPEPRIPEFQLKRSKRLRKLNLKYANEVVVE